MAVEEEEVVIRLMPWMGALFSYGIGTTDKSQELLARELSLRKQLLLNAVCTNCLVL